MQEIVIQLRLLNLYYHHAHHLVCGASFVGDHKLFKDFYKEADEAYDKAAERMVFQLGPDKLDLPLILANVHHRLLALPNMHNSLDNTIFFQAAFTLEQDLCSKCSLEIKMGISEGSRDLLSNICNDSEIRMYKIKQRLLK